MTYSYPQGGLIIKDIMAFEAVRQQLWFTRKAFGRDIRMFFPSPAEVHFMKLMGAKAITIDAVKWPKTRFPLTIFLTHGKLLRGSYMHREVRVGPYYVDFAFMDAYSNKAIEIDGAEWHVDIVKEAERDNYLNERGWSVMHIQAAELYRNPGRVQRRVVAFLAR